jgi:hypothetical protein
MCVAGEKVEVFFSRQKTTKCALGGGGSDGWMDGWTDGWKAGWKDGRMDGQADGQTDRQTVNVFSFSDFSL